MAFITPRPVALSDKGKLVSDARRVGLQRKRGGSAQEPPKIGHDLTMSQAKVK